jgi:hypothetical protein
MLIAKRLQLLQVRPLPLAVERKFAAGTVEGVVSEERDRRVEAAEVTLGSGMLVGVVERVEEAFVMDNARITGINFPALRRPGLE